MTDIDISPQGWGEQSSGLLSIKDRVEEMGAAASGTMAGNPYGFILGPVFDGDYRELSESLKEANVTLGKNFEETAQAIAESAKEFREADDQIAEWFKSVMQILEGL